MRIVVPLYFRTIVAVGLDANELLANMYDACACVLDFSSGGVAAFLWAVWALCKVRTSSNACFSNIYPSDPHAVISMMHHLCLLALCCRKETSGWELLG